MKPGSIVECLKEFAPPRVWPIKIGLPKKGAIYTVTKVCVSGSTPCIGLAEFPAIYLNGKRVLYIMENFKEVEFPPSLEAEIQEMLTQPILIEA